MKNIVVFIMLISSLLFSKVYQVGDIVSDVAFSDTNIENGQTVNYSRSFYGLIDQKKLVVLNYFGVG